MADEHVLEFIPGYALDLLDDADLLRVARHLPHCPLCREQLESYTQTIERLDRAAPLLSPPSDLRAKVVRRVAAVSKETAVSLEPAVSAEAAGSLKPADSLSEEAAFRSGVPARETIGIQDPARSVPAPTAKPSSPTRAGLGALLRDLFPRRAGWAFGLAALVLLALAVSTLLLWQRVNTLQAQSPAAGATLVRLNGTENAPQAVGYLLVFNDHPYGSLTVENAPPLDPARQYQLWLVKDGQRSSGGVFSVNEDGYGTLMISADQPLTQFQTFGITIEPAGGSPGPTGARVLRGTRTTN
jgi:hypothetical protein